MAETVPEEFLDLFERRSFAFLATNLPDGRSTVHPVWCEWDGTHVVISSVEGRLKDRNMRRDPRVTVCIPDPDNPYRYLEVRGRVAAFDTADGEALIDRLARRYLGTEAFPNKKAGDVRVAYRILPERVRWEARTQQAVALPAGGQQR